MITANQLAWFFIILIGIFELWFIVYLWKNREVVW